MIINAYKATNWLQLVLITVCPLLNITASPNTWPPEAVWRPEN